MTEFLKMHGLGNDFIVFDARDPANVVPDKISPTAVRRLADRHFGIGCDPVYDFQAKPRSFLRGWVKYGC